MMTQRLMPLWGCAFGVLFGPTLSSGADERDTNREQLLQACQMLDDAFVTRDIAAIRQYCDPGHLSLARRYQFYTLADQLPTLQRLKLSSNTAGPKTVIWVTDDVALVRYKASLVGSYAGKKIDSQVQVLTTWVRRDGRWVQMSYQETVIDEVDSPAN